MGPPKLGCTKLLNLFNYVQLCGMKNIKAIILDLGGVILNINYQKTINRFENIGVKRASSLYSKQKQNNLFDQIETGAISEKEFLNGIQNLAYKTTHNEIRKAWNSMILNLPDSRIKSIQKVKPKFKIFLLSNTNSIHINEFKRKIGDLEYYKFYNLFEKIYYSHEIGHRKPNIEAFQIILNENNLIANEVLFIDDSYQHIKAAKTLSINTHHLKDDEDLTAILADITQ
ncbi:MAG: haloacid dehalogenase [Flavobacteriales bacterium]|nr:haloacid dehalogenase [Flavobacteriales bacterium]